MRRFVVGDEDNLFGIDEDREHENGQSRANLKVPPPIKTIDTKGRRRRRRSKRREKESHLQPLGEPGSRASHERHHVRAAHGDFRPRAHDD
tara:strand:+ start:246 stop:518 length:273 start_codon:yes stop_codon:yes gene_type:complete